MTTVTIPLSKRDPFVKVQQRAEATIEHYRTSGSNFFKILVMGDSGSGKTSLAASCPTPVFIDSFDPGGTKTAALRSLISTHDIICDTRWETDTWKQPSAFRAWERDMLDRKSDGFFDYLGTYMLDSASKWSDSLMFATLASKNRSGKAPEIQDYLVQQLTAVDWLSWMMDLRCNVLVTAHLGIEKDETTGRVESGPLMYGKLAKKLPIAFDECYIARPQQTSQGPSFRLQTQADGYYIAKSRIGGLKLSLYEDPGIKDLMRKAGAPSEAYTDRDPVFRSQAGTSA